MFFSLLLLVVFFLPGCAGPPLPELSPAAPVEFDFLFCNVTFHSLFIVLTFLIISLGGFRFLSHFLPVYSSSSHLPPKDTNNMEISQQEDKTKANLLICSDKLPSASPDKILDDPQRGEPVFWEEKGKIRVCLERETARYLLVLQLYWWLTVLLSLDPSVFFCSSSLIIF